MGNDMFNDEQLAYAAIVQKETEDAVGFWKERALKAEAKLADKYLIEEQYEAACGDRDGLLRMVETLREQRDALTAERDRYRERLDQFEAAGFPNVAAALDRVNAAEAKVARLREANSEAEVQFLTELEAKRAAEARAEKAEQGGGDEELSATRTSRDEWRRHAEEQLADVLRLRFLGIEFASQYGVSALACNYDNSCDDSGREPACVPCAFRRALGLMGVN